MSIPILWNHDPRKIIGQIVQEADGKLYFRFFDLHVTEQAMHDIFGGAAIQVTEFEMVGDTRLIKAGTIVEFSF